MSPRPRKYSFYLDENFPLPAGLFLRKLGHSVYEGLKILKKPGLPDYKHLDAAKKLGAIVVSFDRDFVVNRDLKEKVKNAPGLILVEAADTKSETAQRILLKVLKSIAHKSMTGRICRASIDKVTFLP